MNPEVIETAVETTTEVAPTVAAKVAANPKGALKTAGLVGLGALLMFGGERAIKWVKAKHANRKAMKENARVKKEQDQKAGIEEEK